MKKKITVRFFTQDGKEIKELSEEQRAAMSQRLSEEMSRFYYRQEMKAQCVEAE